MARITRLVWYCTLAQLFITLLKGILNLFCIFISFPSVFIFNYFISLSILCSSCERIAPPMLVYEGLRTHLVTLTSPFHMWTLVCGEGAVLLSQIGEVTHCIMILTSADSDRFGSFSLRCSERDASERNAFPHSWLHL